MKKTKNEHELLNYLPIRPESSSIEKQEDPLFDDATNLVVKKQMCSATLLQRELGIGFSRASRLVEMLINKGICS